jgi:hypothetical protein
VGGQMLSTGGVLLEVTDNGVGISDQELAHANWRLDHPPVVDVAVSRRMGLFVVGRLAARHGVRVRLQHAKGAGLTALIWLPDTVAEPDPAPPLGALRRRFDVDRHRPAVPSRARVAGPATPAGGWMSLSGAPSQPPTSQPPTPIPAASPGPAVSPSPEVVAADQPGAGPGPEQRLPIFDMVESDWFHRSGKTFHDSAPTAPTAPTAPSASPGWASPADAGWRAAQVVASPTTGARTRSGLPKRVPSANLVPGSVRPTEAHQAEAESGTSPRSAEEMRDRLTGLQRGVRRGRAAPPGSQEADENTSWKQ